MEKIHCDLCIETHPELSHVHSFPVLLVHICFKVGEIFDNFLCQAEPVSTAVWYLSSRITGSKPGVKLVNS
jgi:hypothetical protein